MFAETETNAYADVVLPGAMWTEAEGVLINSERNLTLAQPAADPPGEATADWRIIAAVARAMGYEKGFAYDSAEEVFEEIKRAWNPVTGWDLRGVSYQRLRATPVQWPVATADGSDRNPIRYLGEDGSPAFPTPNGRAVFYPRPHIPPAEMPDDDYPYLLNTGRLQHQWHTLTKTAKVAKLNKLNPGPFVEVHPRDAAELGVADGEPVEVASRRGRAVLPAVVTERVRPGCCFAPFHWNDLFGEYLLRQRGDQRCRRPAVVPARVQGVRGVAGQGAAPPVTASGAGGRAASPPSRSRHPAAVACRHGGTRPAAAASRARPCASARGPAPPGHGPVGLQTGNAEAASRRRRAGRGSPRKATAPPSLPMAEADPAALPDDADLLLITSTFRRR